MTGKMKITALVTAATIALTSCGTSKNTIIAQPQGVGKGDANFDIKYGIFEKVYNGQLSSWGIEDDQADDVKEKMEELRLSIVDNLIFETVVVQKAKEEGLDEFTQEEQTDMLAEENSTLEQIIKSFEEVAAAEDSALSGDKLTEEAEKLLDKQLKEMGSSRDEFTEDVRMDIRMKTIFAKVFAHYTDDITMTPTEIAKEAEELFKSNADAYKSDYSIQDFYAPTGSKYIKHILISFDDEVVKEISTLKSSKKTKEAEELRDKSLAEILDKSNEILAKAENADEKEFDNLIKEFGNDPGTESFPEGYLVIPDQKDWAEEFYNGAMALENVGDKSKLIATDFGYHILFFAKKGEVTKEELEAITDVSGVSLVQDKKTNHMTELAEKWIDEADYTINYSKINVPEPKETENTSN